MLYLLHEASDLELAKSEITPLLEGRGLTMVEFPLQKDFELEKDSILLLYLPDIHLREFIPLAGLKKWPVGILPHPKNKFTSRGLGISANPEKAIKEILQENISQKVDILFCNDVPVFSSVKIGNIFLIEEREDPHGFFSEIIHLFRNIRRVSSLSHDSYEFSTDDEKIIHTSALGMVVVDHSSNSLVSKRLLKDELINDGTFHTFILSPRNVLVLLWFFLRSLWPRKKLLSRFPSFIGSIKTSNLKIRDSEEIEYLVDGVSYSAEEIFLDVHPKALVLKQKSIYYREDLKTSGKKSLKIEALPKGETRKELIRRPLPLVPRASSEEFEELFKLLRENATIRGPYLVMMILSATIATFGLFANSSPVIIGAMILAPIITPIVSFSMGMVRYDVSMLKKGLGTIAAGTFAALFFAALVSFIIPLQIITPQIEARLSPTLLDMGIAVASGIAAGYAHAKEEIAKSLAGVAIAVALVPPLSVAGIGIGWLNWQVFSGAILLYLTNLAGIILFAGITFLLLGFAPFKRAKMGLIYTLVIVILLGVPLSLSFDRIQQEANITGALEGTSIRDVVLRDVQVRFAEPMVVSLKLVGSDAITAERLELIKEKIEEKIGRSVVLEVVSAIEF